MLGRAGFENVEIRGCDGALLADVPLVRRGARRRGSRAYRALERLMPSAFSRCLIAVARR
jgi:hypothetical protein